jgi:hypothetical protein
MRDGFASICLEKKNYERTSLKLSKNKIRCLFQEIRTNLSKRNHKVVYKYEGIWSSKGCVGKL